MAGTLMMAAILVGLMPHTGGAAEKPAEPAGLAPTLEVLKPFSYEGDPLLIRLAVFNTADKPYTNSGGIDLLGGLAVSNAKGERLKMKGKPPADAKQQPAVIPAGGFFGLIVDIAPLIPDLARAGSYTLAWEGAAGTAPPLMVRVVPRFDPKAAYIASMETEYGFLEFDLKTKEAPLHVQNFYDLAVQGYYDNTQIHQIIKGVEMRGGDPTGTGAGSPGYNLNQEIVSDLKHERGTLSMMPAGSGQDHGSQFVVTLSPMSRYDGRLSIFGQLRGGEETLTAVENIPTSGQLDVPHYRPVRPVTIKTVKVTKAEASGM